MLTDFHRRIDPGPIGLEFIKKLELCSCRGRQGQKGEAWLFCSRPRASCVYRMTASGYENLELIVCISKEHKVPHNSARATGVRIYDSLIVSVNSYLVTANEERLTSVFGYVGVLGNG